MRMDVTFEGVNLFYGKRNNKVHVLNNVTMRVGSGSIYGLVGPSGSGKTSVLSCCLGVQTPHSGSILVGGKEPGDPDLGIPGPNVGYMPQELSVHGFFNSEEILHYYGRVFQVPDLPGNVKETLRLLDLWGHESVEKRRIDFLSGGQKRRVSLACALIHKPKLLILDEPTVGVDPLLRKTIWTELVALAKAGTTVLITTHYLEEVASANRVGFLRDGTILVEDDPQSLMRTWGEPSLEHIFLKLCIPQMGPAPGSDQLLAPHPHEFLAAELPTVLVSPTFSPPIMPTFQAVFKPLIFKNLKILQRHTVLLSFQAILPVLTYLMFLVCVGRPLHGLQLGIVNQESSCCPQARTNLTCQALDYQILLLNNGFSLSDDLSCHFVDHLSREVFHLGFYHTESKVRESLILGQIHGYVLFPTNFSTALSQRVRATIDLGTSMTNATWDASQISVHVDASNVEVLATIHRNILATMEQFFIFYGDTCHWEPLVEVLTSPGIQVHPLRPQFNHDQFDLSELMFPGLMTLLLNLLPMALTADQLMTEKQSGLLLRDLMCRIPLTAILATQIFCQLTVVLAQLISSLVLLKIIFPTTSVSILLFAGFLLFLQALCGMTLGTFITSMCHSRDQVINVGMAVVMPAFIVSGILWPRSTMPPVLQWVSSIFPTTFACDSMRNLILNNTFYGSDLWKAIALPTLGTVLFFSGTLFMVSKLGMR